MKRFVLFATLSLALALAVSAAAEDRSFQMTDGNYGMLYGGSANLAKASRDTTYLLGGPGAYNGKFQDQFGNPNWQGWTHSDITFSAVQRWNVVSGADIQPPLGALVGQVIWCGQTNYPNACDDGYGNSWNENLQFVYTVSNNTVNTTVNLQAKYNNDTEEGFDYFRVQYNGGGVWQDVVPQSDGLDVNQTLNANVTFTPSDYVGPGSNQLQLRFVGFSDGAWSDEDCLYDTDGLAQVDDIQVTIGAQVFFENHEDGDNDYWSQVFASGVGDFSKLWQGLQDIDPCAANLSPMVAFIDDGVVVPGTGGYPCTTWCYGPGGYIVNPVGGLAGPASHLENLIVSPVLNWPAGNDGAILGYDVYRHEELVTGVSSGMFYQWHVRSALNATDLAAAAWQDRNFVYYGKSYLPTDEVVTDLLEPGRTHVQVALRCIEYGWVWNYAGTDGTPAPYFDNVRFRVFPFTSPSIAARDIDLANDSFPERGVVDLANLANNWIRFDMARNIAAQAAQMNDPGDSIYVDIGLPRAGSVLNEMPKLVVKMQANPVFDGVRVLPAGFTQAGGFVEGWVYGDSTRQSNGTVIANRYNFDLPDSNFFFPGDIIHYYIEASDNLNGDIGTSTLPADISGFDDWDSVMPYDGQSTYIVRGLPTMFNESGDQPRILWWNDFANRGGENEWLFALGNLGYHEGIDFDQYYTNGPSSGVGNGLGGRATAQTIGGYDVLLYSAGDLATNTIANGDFTVDPSNDIGVLTNWFSAGGKKAYLSGDDLVYSMTISGGSAQTFMNNYLGVRFINNNIVPLIGSQTAPNVVPVAGNSVFTTPDKWNAFGGCLTINDFDAIETTGSTERLARFTNAAGVPSYTYAAATRYTNTADVIVMPYDFMFIYNTPDYVPNTPGLSARAEVLQDILVEFGVLDGPEPPIGVPNADVFAVSNFPNPFNPATTIKLNVPKAGHVSLKIFNVRGELVRTMVDGNLEAQQHEFTWAGQDNSGNAVSSGIYFYETRYNGETTVNKMALVK